MKTLASQGGQLTIEAILIMCIFTSIALGTIKFMQGDQLVSKLVEGPWKPVQGMIENGVWETGDKAMGDHPSMRKRHLSNQGDPVPPNG